MGASTAAVSGGAGARREVQAGRRDRDRRVIDEADQRLPHLFGRNAREDAAVDGGPGALRQGVVGMAGLEHGGDAGGAQHGVIAGDPSTAARRRRCPGVGDDRAHGRPGLAADDLGHAGEIGAVGVVELDRELIAADPVDAACQMVDGVVGHRPRAVAAGVGDFQDEAGRGLFGGEHRCGRRGLARRHRAGRPRLR